MAGNPELVSTAEGPKPSAARRLLARLTGRGEHASAWLKAGSAFAIRVASAALLFVTQILLARWMGSHEFGVYVYAWTLVILVGDLVPLGFALTAQRIIPSYLHSGETSLLRGFLVASRGFVFVLATLVAAIAAGLVMLVGPRFSDADPTVIAIAAMALPAYASANVLDGVARSFGHVNLALVPPYIVRPIMLILMVSIAHWAGFATDAVAAMLAAVASAWIVVAAQMLLVDRTLAAGLPPGPRDYRFAEWFGLSIRIFGSWCFVTLFTYADVIVLNAFATPDQVAIYYASVKTLALTSFIAYAVASVFGPKFVERHVAGDRDGLERLLAFAVTWTFWPSFAITLLLLAVGRPVLALFGPDFVVGYELLFILSIGLLARAAVGPAERLLNVLGEQRATAKVYAAAFLANLVLALTLVPGFGLVGAAIAIAAATVVEALLLAIVVHRRLGLHAFVWARPPSTSGTGGVA